MKLAEIASALEATLDGPDGTAEVEATGIADIEAAGPGEITFVSNPKYAAAAKATKAAAVIVDNDFPEIAVPTLRCRNPHLTYALAIELFYKAPHYPPGIHPTAVVDHSARIGRNAHIGAYVVIDAGVEIGDDAVLLPHVVIYRDVHIGHKFWAHAHAVVREDCRIGNNVILQNGVVVGADGFGFAKNAAGEWHKILQSGQTVIEDNVEIQANACVDRAALGQTHIGRGVKIDNLTQVAHGCEVGENSLLCAQVGLAGSTIIGKNVILAGQAGVAGHCTVGDGAVITAQSGTHGDIEAGKIVSGSPAFDNKQWLRSTAVFGHLPELAKSVRLLTAKLEAMHVTTENAAKTGKEQGEPRRENTIS